jgi:hypothetical protein
MFDGFTFASEVRLGRLARFYGLFVRDGDNETSLADFVRARLPNTPTLGDRISFATTRQRREPDFRRPHSSR